MASGLPVLVGAELPILVGAGTDGRTLHRTWLPSTFSTSAESARSAVRLATVGRISSIRWAIHCWSTRVAGMCTAWTLVLTPNIQTAGCPSSLAMSEQLCRTIRHRTLTLSRGPTRNSYGTAATSRWAGISQFLSPLGNRANRIGASAGSARSSTSRVRVSTESAHAAAHTAQLD